MIMYGAVIPSYSSSKADKAEKHDVIKADDPRNKERVKAFFDSID
jgi:hypothetical protein